MTRTAGSLPLGHRAGATGCERGCVGRRAPRAGSTPACGSCTSAQGETWQVEADELGVRRRPARPGPRRRRASTQRRERARGPSWRAARRSSPAPPTSPTRPPAPRLDAHRDAAAGPGRGLRGPRHEATSAPGPPSGTSPAGERARRAPGRRQRLPRGAQLRRAGGARRGLDHRVRGGDPGRQLELLPAPQARRGAAGRGDRARGDLLLRDPGEPRGRRRAAGRGPGGLPARLRHRRAADRRAWPRSGPGTWCWCRTAGTGPRWRPPATTCTTST